MKFIRFASLFILFCFVSSCEKDDAPFNSGDSLYSGIDTSASPAQLTGIWSIYNISYEGNILNVPVIHYECGRDFLVFSENGRYTEYLFQDSGCTYDINDLSWELDGGIITLSNQFNQSEEWVITKLDDNQLIFKYRFDIDEDGSLDILTLYLQHYTPIEIDMVTSTFWENPDEAYDELISFTWQAYQGFNTFDKYEIYRSLGGNCSLSSAELIATINDVNVTEFTDLNPPGEPYLCYYLKVYTDQGLLGESHARTISTGTLYPSPVALSQPTVVGNTIEFDWQASTDPYFSHYELAFSNYSGGSGSGKQEYTVATINDIQTTSFVDEMPPYLENPYYVLYVHNIFGGRTSFVNSQVTTYWEVDYKREDIIDFQKIESYAIDIDNPVVFFYGRESGSGNTMNIHRFNYQTKQTEAISNLAPQYGTNVTIKCLDTGYGKEIIVEQASDLFVYDAITLDYKYTIDTGISGLDDFTYSNLGYWILVDSDEVFTFTRDHANFELVDSKPHFPNHQSSFNYQVFALNGDKVLVGHQNESTSYVYALSTGGVLVQEQIVPIPIKSGWDYKTQYNAGGNYLINLLENRLYSTTTFSILESFGAPYFPSGTSLNGDLILGSNNDPSWQITSTSIHAKEAVIFNRNTGQVAMVSTIGYPQVIFETAFGDIISISSGLKKNDIHDNINSKADLFLEIIEVP